MSVTPDIIARQRFTTNLQGDTYIRRFLVTGLQSADTSAVLADAVVACGYQYGQPHPTISGIYASQADADPFDDKSRSQAWVTITYTSPNLSNTISIKGSSTTQNEPYSKDPTTGLPITVSYKGQIDTVKLNVPICKGTWEYTRIEQQDPGSKSDMYTGTCNQDTFRGGAPLTWRVRSIDFDWLGPPTRSSPGGYRVTYSFENAGKGNDFTQLYLWVDRGPTHLQPFDATIKPLPFSGDSGNGIYRYIPPQTSFGDLNIPGT